MGGGRQRHVPGQGNGVGHLGEEAGGDLGLCVVVDADVGNVQVAQFRAAETGDADESDVRVLVPWNTHAHPHNEDHNQLSSSSRR